jgi:hypothetical protein
MFRAFSYPSSGATTAVAASGLPSELGDSSVIGRGRATAVVAPDDGHDNARNMLSSLYSVTVHVAIIHS